VSKKLIRLPALGDRQRADPINHVYSLPGKYIAKKCFTYRSIQIFKIMFWGFIFKNPTKIWSSAQDHALIHLLLNTVGFFISVRRNLPYRNDLYSSCTSFQGASSRGKPLNIFTWFIGSGGLLLQILSEICVDWQCVTCTKQAGSACCWVPLEN